MSATPREFVAPHSLARTIWGDPDVILLIFGGAAAEFALNRAVDWLFFTGSLPADPVGRLFSTVRYAQQIVFASEERANKTLRGIRAIHAGVEHRREQRIPDWAYRDVLYMLIDHSRRAYELLHRPLTRAENDDLYESFRRVGVGMEIPDLPGTYAAWQADREAHLQRDLVYSEWTRRLFDRYRDQLGPWRYRILLEIQALLVPARVRELLGLDPKRLVVGSAVQAYALMAQLGLQRLLHRALIPPQYWADVSGLSRPAA